MKITRKFHGVLDCLSAILLILSPWLFNFSQYQTPKLIVVTAGAVVIMVAMLTNYEAGLIRKISMSKHLASDILFGLLLSLSPWLFKFAHIVYLPHLIIGIFSILAGLLTERTNYRNSN